ncbi:ATP-binding protein [Sphingomonas sp. IC-11]|uniref:ATP-binding protein n=1 Tax=Sphingomonas sp. IC-11 TaxID=2898528 RepID=UPI001E29376A|nr:ATP-binding protein [Sphingomonas sp. IC-11]MCD2314542.1 ATP-binding protein [Sphingomonas sp. IC-11]
MAIDLTHASGTLARLLQWLRRFATTLNGPQPVRPAIPQAAPGAVAAKGSQVPRRETPGAPARPIRTARELAGITDPRRQAVNASFNSTQPIASRRDLYGRTHMLEALFEAVVDRHQHALIYGARGSGKTSLVRVFADYADQQGMTIIYTACEPQQSFGALMALYLGDVPDTAVAPRDLAAFRERARLIGKNSGVRDVVEALSFIRRGRTVFILDEYDRVTDPEVRAETAALLKMLSDASIPVQIMLVGIARDLRHLINDHPSLRRHLSAFPLGRIDARSVREMIQNGGQKIGITFDDDSQQLILDLACGSPYHARLFCAHAVLRTLREGREQVSGAAALAGIVTAAEDWSRLSGEDAELFHDLVNGPPGETHALAAVARLAAVEDVVSHARLHQLIGADATMAIARFGPALVPDGADCHVFRDSVAPQFFLGILATHAAQASDPHDQSPITFSASR